MPPRARSRPKAHTAKSGGAAGALPARSRSKARATKSGGAAGALPSPPISAADAVFRNEELLRMIARFCLRSHGERPINLQRVCRLAATAARDLPDPIAQLAGIKRSNKSHKYHPSGFVQSELEHMLLLKPEQLKRYPFHRGKSRSTGYEYHSFYGALIPRIVADHGGLDALEARVRKKQDRRDKVEATKRARANMTDADMLAQADEANAKRARVADARNDALAARLASLAHAITAKDLPFDSAEDARAFVEDVGLMDELAPFFARMVTSKVGVKRVAAALAERAPIAQVTRELRAHSAPLDQFPDVPAARSARDLRKLVARFAAATPASGVAGDAPDAPDAPDALAAALRAATIAELRRQQRTARVARELRTDPSAQHDFPLVHALHNAWQLSELVERVGASVPREEDDDDDAVAAALLAAVRAELGTMQAEAHERRAALEARKARELQEHGAALQALHARRGSSVHTICQGGGRCSNSPAKDCAHGRCGRCCPGCSRHPRT